LSSYLTHFILFYLTLGFDIIIIIVIVIIYRYLFELTSSILYPSLFIFW